MLAFLYQRRGPKQKLHWGYFDPSRWPNPRAWVEQKLGELARLLWPLWKHDIPPMAGGSKVAVGADVLKAAERAAPKPRYMLSNKQQPTYNGTGRAGRYTLINGYQSAPTYTGSPGGITTPIAGAYSALPLELRLLALGLHETKGPGE
jgi:hypothetical protein